MPLEKIVLIIVSVIAAAGVTVWVGTMLMATLQVPVAGWLLFIPAMLIGYIVWRVVAERLQNSEDDHYDNIEK